jgi:excisionase family DNA binding protein
MTPDDRDLRLFPIAEAARMLGVSRKTLDREARAGRLVLTKVRWLVFVAAEDLEAWLRACRQVKAPRIVQAPRPRELRLANHRAVRDDVLARRGTR